MRDELAVRECRLIVLERFKFVLAQGGLSELDRQLVSHVDPPRAILLEDILMVGDIVGLVCEQQVGRFFSDQVAIVDRCIWNLLQLLAELILRQMEAIVREVVPERRV